VELFERIRRDREFEGLSIRALARRYGVHRRGVRQALEPALPPAKRRPTSRPAPALGSYRALIDSWLEADRGAPPKQRHAAKRIHARLVEKHGARVAETTVLDYVRRRRRELGLAAEAFCPQVHDPGMTAEVDWGEARVSIAGALVTVGLFLMRSCFSGAAFVVAFATQSQRAFFEGHVQALEFFGGVFRTIRYEYVPPAHIRSSVPDRVMCPR
jgi:transposase